METIQFKDRVSTYPNRRKLKIISQVGNDMVADIEFADEATQQGTPINATTMNKKVRHWLDSWLDKVKFLTNL